MKNGSHIERLRVIIRGAVQGVGFRPFVHRLATEAGLSGWISNTAQGVFIEVEGAKETVDKFLLSLQREKPPRAFVQSLEFSYLDPAGFHSFEIRESTSDGTKSAFVLPDIATCPDCLAEVFDPTDRRYLYPFTNCTNCGPRFTIVEALPYDRASTSMKKFKMCPECMREYENPLDRRFHAQPNACPGCGPRLELWDAEGTTLATHHEAMFDAARAIRSGRIVAVKGLGGFHLVADARNDDAVRILRHRKYREEKPFALMYPSLKAVKNDCEVSAFEERLLLSPESPIVLLDRLHSRTGPSRSSFDNRLPTFPIAPSVAPGNPSLGVMLPYTPLHHILMRELGFPVVATSGNLSDEPICIDEHEALERLGGIADLFLVHDRPIVRHVDDSIVRVQLGRELVMRRARGYAPLPVSMEALRASPVLAVGGYLKNTIALTAGKNAFISQHIGDLETKQSLDAFSAVITDFQKLYDVNPVRVVCDMHPDYASSKFARTLNVELMEVQHHYAHVAACMAENQLEGEALGVSWDGTGYGLDRTIWGGEFLLTDETSFKRVATLRSFRLPGGEKAIKEPRRAAIGVLYELSGSEVFGRNDTMAQRSFSSSERAILLQMLEKGLNSPLTTSAGRLFDAVASLIGIRQTMSFEGQAAMELEYLTARESTQEHYEFRIAPASNGHATNAALHPLLVVDWSPMINQLLEDVRCGALRGAISAKFHNTLAEIIVEVARKVRQQRVVLTGGCFQNRYLTERTVERLRAEGFRPYWHQRIPPNDGGISLGQIYASARLHRKPTSTNRELIRQTSKERALP